MQTLDTFLDKDIPTFLDNFKQNKEKSEASEAEIKSLLGNEYQKNVHKAINNGSFVELPSKNYPVIKTTNIFTEIPKPLKTNNVHVTKEFSKKNSSNDDIPISEKEIKDIIPKNKKEDSTFNPKYLLRTLGSTKREDLVIYVKALVALENKNKKDAVSLFYSLARKYLRNLAFRIRLQDALLLPGEAIPLPALPKPVKESSLKKKVEKVKKTVTVDNKSLQTFKIKKTTLAKKSSPKNYLAPYVEAVEAIKKRDKDSAVNLLNELIRSKPNNLAFRLRLQEALKL